MPRGSIIYIFPKYSSFVKKDIKLLSKTYIVKTPKHDWGKKLNTPLSFIKQLIFLSRHIYSAKVIIVRFGGYWSFFPALFGRLFKKPVFIILGGTDCVSFPSIKYGSLRKLLLRYFIKWSYQLCTRLLPVDESLVFCNYSYYEQRDYENQGYKFFFPRLTTEYSVIHNGFDHEYFNVHNTEKESYSFITIASISDMKRFYLKGINLVLKLAEIYTQCSFTVIGVSEKISEGLSRVPSNLTLYPFLPSDQFKEYLSKSEFYLQLSISEGFPNALCEAMLCRCIPIGSAVGGVPFIIKDTGFIMESSNVDYLTNKFEKILYLPSSKRLDLASKARSRIVNNFDIKKREQSFLELINNHC